MEPTRSIKKIGYKYIALLYIYIYIYIYITGSGTILFLPLQQWCAPVLQ